ncbi:Atu4866 domain-containing protein [Nocardiopsis sp. NPDC006938]|uniref:Atu4866 domain-containing protein n=1 Tax=Nocardiopsis sp. NPDC006938 TaxID=3364337 RepID=UPI0036B11D08
MSSETTTHDPGSPLALEEIQRRADDPGRRVLFTNATVVTMDPEIGTLERADVLVEGDSIAQVGAVPQAGDAVVIDATGTIITPGFVDTHRHAWQSQLRRIMPDVDDLVGYVTTTLAGYAPLYEPRDMYVGTRLAALSAIDAGITCMLDFSHNSRSREHSDAAVRALVDSGVRGVHAAMGPHFGAWDQQWPGDLARLRDEYAGGSDRMLTLRVGALATDEIAGPSLAYGPGLARVAREMDVGVSVDAVLGASSSRAVRDWARQGLLGPNVTLIHATGLTDEAWKLIGETGTTVSLAPTSDAQIGLETAIPAVDEALAVGVRPGLSIDVEVALAGDMFTQMRALHTVQRMRAVNAAYGADAEPVRIGVHDVLDFATLQGARTNGLGGVTGSLTPGKRADLLVIAAEDLNNMPLNNPVGTVVLGADARNIVTVLVNGEPRKWNGRVLDIDLDALRGEVRVSRDRLLGQAGAGRGPHERHRTNPRRVNAIERGQDTRSNMNDLPTTTPASSGSSPATRPGRDEALLAQLGDPGGRPLLLTGGVVITNNPLMGDWLRADVLIGGEVIVGVGPGLLTAAGDDGMIVVDCSGTVVLPATLDLTRDHAGGTLTPGGAADVAVFRYADEPGAPEETAPAGQGRLDVQITGGRVRVWDGRPVQEPGAAPGRVKEPVHDPLHPHTGLWVEENGFVRQELLPNGRYDEARGDRESAYTGRYWINGSRIDYLDDLGFWAFGEFDGDVLHHAGYRFTRH